jgi:hypothetical protein
MCIFFNLMLYKIRGFCFCVLLPAATLTLTNQNFFMLFLMKISAPRESFNAAIGNGSIEKRMGEILAASKPEAAYFTEMSGERTAILIVNIDHPSEMARFAEPWFITFHADVKFHPVMLPDDLAKAGLQELGKKWG